MHAGGGRIISRYIMYMYDNVEVFIHTYENVMCESVTILYKINACHFFF